MSVVKYFSKVFQVHPEYVQLNPAFRDYAERSARVEEVLREWRAGGKFVTLRGWREECYEVRAQFNTPPLFKMDRSATCMYFTITYIRLSNYCYLFHLKAVVSFYRLVWNSQIRSRYQRICYGSCERFINMVAKT